MAVTELSHLKWADYYAQLSSNNFGDVYSSLEKIKVIYPVTLYRVILRSLVNHPDDHIRDMAVELLNEVGEDCDLRLLLLASRDESWFVRTSAASALSDWKSPEAIARLEAMARHDRQHEVRRWAVRAIYDFDHTRQESRLYFLALLERERNPRVRLMLYHVLVLSGHKEFLSEMISLGNGIDIKSGFYRRRLAEDLKRYLDDILVSSPQMLEEIRTKT